MSVGRIKGRCRVSSRKVKRGSPLMSAGVSAAALRDQLSSLVTPTGGVGGTAAPLTFNYFNLSLPFSRQSPRSSFFTLTTSPPFFFYSLWLKHKALDALRWLFWPGLAPQTSTKKHIFWIFSYQVHMIIDKPASGRYFLSPSRPPEPKLLPYFVSITILNHIKRLMSPYLAGWRPDRGYCTPTD